MAVELWQLRFELWPIVCPVRKACMRLLFEGGVLMGTPTWDAGLHLTYPHVGAAGVTIAFTITTARTTPAQGTSHLG